MCVWGEGGERGKQSRLHVNPFWHTHTDTHTWERQTGGVYLDELLTILARMDTLDTGCKRSHGMELLGISTRLNQRHEDGDNGDDKDACRVEVVLVNHPEAHGKDLEQVEGRENLVDQEFEIGLDLKEREYVRE